jgi:sporulation protein YlmC with PRC-barrel domain
MLVRATAFKGYFIQATDGTIGTVSDLLIDDRNWHARWLVVDTGTLLPGRKVLIAPAAVAHCVHDQQQMLMTLTRDQVAGSPPLDHDAPVSRQMEEHLNDYYGWDPYWGSDMAGGHGAISSALSPPPLFGAALPTDADIAAAPHREGDPHLRSLAALLGYHIAATDGSAGHLEDLVIEDRTWAFRYLAVDTRRWFSGGHVLLPVLAARNVDWAAKSIHVDLTREQVKDSPPWDMNGAIPEDYDALQESGYGWRMEPAPAIKSAVPEPPEGVSPMAP